jgi:hypothetical protein
MRVIDGGKGTQGSKEDNWSRRRRGGGSGCRGRDNATNGEKIRITVTAKGKEKEQAMYDVDTVAAMVVTATEGRRKRRRRRKRRKRRKRRHCRSCHRQRVYGHSVLHCSGPAIQNSTKQNVNHVPCEWQQLIYMFL